MKKLLANILPIYFLFFSCTSDNNEPMQIRHTKLNDYYADYIFNLKNDNNGLKMIIDFANKSNDETKRIHESHKKESEKKNKEKLTNGDNYEYTFEFRTGVSDMIFYTPPNEFSFDRPREKDVVINFQRKEGKCIFTDIEIPHRFLENDLVIDEISTKENKTILKTNKPLNLGVLKGIMKKIHQLNYHLKENTYTYEVLNNRDKDTLTMLYNSYGKYLNIKI